jgi:hypothetical protein
MAVQATVTLGLTVRETVGTDAAGYVSSSQNAVTYNGGNAEATLNASSTPAATVHAVGKVALSSGTATLDLTSLTGLNGAAVSLSGLKPRVILMHNTGANAMTVAKGASNGYTGLGSSGSLTIPPGGKVLLYPGANGTAVGSGDKTLDLTGTGAQELKYQIVAGA